MFWKRFPMLAFVLAVSASLSTWGKARNSSRNNVDAQILADLRANGSVSFFVVMREQADTSSAADISDWNLRGETVMEILQQTANITQEPLMPLLFGNGADVTPFWIINVLKVTTSNEGLIAELAGREDVNYLKADVAWGIPNPPYATDEQVQTVEWGVARVHAPDVWEQYGVRGCGMVVANIDTGVRFDHPALRNQYRGLQPDGVTFDHNYNWHDPSHICPPGMPCDNAGHGSHTMGTMVGDDGGNNQIGVAPGAKWIAAKGCESTSCSLSALLSSGQFMVAPTDLDGQNPRPDLRPNVINNSWGDGTSDPFYQGVVVNWRNAGMAPIFANGNNGPSCSSVSVPGAYPESLGIGAIDINDNIAGFSGRGPATAFGGIVKPDVSAPGVNVRSSLPNNGYGNMSGTSMATPHVAGVVALLWSAVPSLVGDIPTTFDLVETTAFFRSSTQCGVAGPPNNVYGWGIVDALAAVQAASASPE